MDWHIPLGDVEFGTEEEEVVLQVLRSRWLTMGSITQAFEKEFAAMTGSRHAIAVTNATAALHLACIACGMGPADEVIVPALTFVATANAVRYTGATPVFADIVSEQDLTISVKSIENCLTEKTRAIIVMHYGGYACDMQAIMAFANGHGLAVIEDAAHAAGAALEGRGLGSWGRAGCFSFFSNKNMTTGEGGMLVTDDDAVAVKVRNLRSHGMSAMTWDRHQGHAWSYDVTALGYNYRIDEIHSAIGRVQLEKLARINARRARVVAQYNELLLELAPSITVPFQRHRGLSSYHIFPILLPKGGDRLAFMESMKAERIQTSIHYPPIHKFSAYAEINQSARAPLPVTEDVVDREVTLPLYPGLSENDVLTVVRAVQKAMN